MMKHTPVPARPRRSSAESIPHTREWPLRCIAWLVLGIIVTGAFWLLYLSAHFALPLQANADERVIMRTVFRMYRHHSANPEFFNYPSLFIYVQALLLAPFSSAVTMVHTAEGAFLADVYFRGRLLTALFSCGTIALTYAAAAQVTRSRAGGIFAAAMLAVSPLFLKHSYTITVDVPMTFFVTLLLYFSVRIRRENRSILYLFAGAAAGAAVATKYNAGMAALIPLSAAFARNGIRDSATGRNLVRAGLVCVITFFLCTPFAILDNAAFVDSLMFEMHHYSNGHPGAESEYVSYGFYLHELASSLGPWGMLPFVAGLAGVLVPFRRKQWWLLVFPVAYMLFVGRFKVHFDRNIVVVVPFLAVLQGYGMSWAVARIRRLKSRHGEDGEAAFHRWKQAAAFVLVIAGCIAVCTQGAQAVSRAKTAALPDTRVVATDWIDAHIPSGAHIAMEFYTPRPSQTKFTIKKLGCCGLYNHRDTIGEYEYIVTSSEDYGRFFNAGARYPRQTAFYRDMFARYRPIKEFKPVPGVTGGPVIKIFAVTP